jgi:hypothetical protein
VRRDNSGDDRSLEPSGVGDRAPIAKPTTIGCRPDSPRRLRIGTLRGPGRELQRRYSATSEGGLIARQEGLGRMPPPRRQPLDVVVFQPDREHSVLGLCMPDCEPATGTKLHKIWQNHPSPLCCHGRIASTGKPMNTNPDLFRLLWIYLKVCWHERKLRRLNAAAP